MEFANDGKMDAGWGESQLLPAGFGQSADQSGGELSFLSSSQNVTRLHDEFILWIEPLILRCVVSWWNPTSESHFNVIGPTNLCVCARSALQFLQLYLSLAQQPRKFVWKKKVFWSERNRVAYIAASAAVLPLSTACTPPPPSQICHPLRLTIFSHSPRSTH